MTDMDPDATFSYPAEVVYRQRLELARLRAIEVAARATLEGWDAYTEAHAGRHAGPHLLETALEGACGPCTSAMYGTEVQMGEYVMPALREALQEPTNA